MPVWVKGYAIFNSFVDDVDVTVVVSLHHRYRNKTHSTWQARTLLVEKAVNIEGRESIRVLCINLASVTLWMYGWVTSFSKFSYIIPYFKVGMSSITNFCLFKKLVLQQGAFFEDRISGEKDRVKAFYCIRRQKKAREVHAYNLKIQFVHAIFLWTFLPGHRR